MEGVNSRIKDRVVEFSGLSCKRSADFLSTIECSDLSRGRRRTEGVVVVIVVNSVFVIESITSSLRIIEPSSSVATASIATLCNGA